ncbi:MAG: ABC transporter permease [Rhizobiaceae bacterium]
MMHSGLAGRLFGAVVVAICAYLILPTLVVVPVSFTETSFIVFPPKGFSLRWYAEFLSDPAWRNATLTSILVATVSAICATSVGTLAAFGLNRLSGVLARAAIWLLLLPMLVPSIILAVGFYGVLARFGIVGTKFGLIVTHTVLAIPFVVITVSATIQKLDWRIVDAARSLGAGPVTAFWKITVPAILPGILAGATFAFLTSFDEIVVAFFVSGVNSVTLPVQMWNGIRFEISPAVAAASSILLALSLVVVFFVSVMRRREETNARRPAEIGHL